MRWMLGLVVVGIGWGQTDYRNQLKNKPFISVTDAPYSAKGDGVANDTAALTSAATAALSSGSALYIPNGNYKIGCFSLTLDEKPLTIIGAGGGTAYGANTNFTSTCTSAPAMQFVGSNNHAPHIYISGFQVTGAGSSSHDCLYIGGPNGTLSGSLDDISATNCTGSPFAGIHLNNVEEIVASGLQSFGNYDGLQVDGGSANNQFNNPRLQANAHAGLSQSGVSGNNAYYSGLFQSNAFGCVLNGNVATAFYSPWFENNSNTGCTLTNEGGWQMTGVHATWPGTYFMTITASGTVAPGFFTAGSFSGGQPGIELASANGTGNTWVGIPVGHFHGTGSSPLIENILSAPLAGTVLRGLRTGNSGNTDQAGFLTVGGGGSITYTFTATYSSAPVCIATQNTGVVLAPLIQDVGTTAFTLFGTAGAQYGYFCIFKQ